MADENDNSQNSQSEPDSSQTESEKAIAKALMVSLSWTMAGLFNKSKSEEGDRGSKD